MELTRACTTTPPPVTVSSANFTFYRRTAFESTFTFKKADGTGLPLTDTLITFYIVEDDGDGTEVLTLTSDSISANGSTITMIDEPNGKVLITVTDEETTELEVGELKWWVTITPIDGLEKIRGKGSIHVINPY